MTTENTDGLIELPDRTIDELLKLDTYQDMSDSEIQTIIDYYKRLSYESALSTAEIAAHTEAMNTMIERNDANSATLLDMVQSIVTNMPEMTVVS